MAGDTFSISRADNGTWIVLDVTQGINVAYDYDPQSAIDKAINVGSLSGIKVPEFLRPALTSQATAIEKQLDAANAPKASNANAPDPNVADGDKTGDVSPKQVQKDSQKSTDSTTKTNTNNSAAVKNAADKSTSSTTPPASNTDTTKSKGTSAQSKLNPTDGLPGRRPYNPLGDFSSSAYQLSLFIVKPESYNAFITGDYVPTSDMELICKSGGIKNDKNFDNPRAEGFDLDFYIDNLEIVTYTSSRATGYSSNSQEFKFQIIEPYGFTFPTKLIAAQTKVAKNSAIDQTKQSGKPVGPGGMLVTSNVFFILMIHFYGYDKEGNLVTGEKYSQPDMNQRYDSQAVFERSFPISITDIKFRLDNKATVYNIRALQTPEVEAKGAKRNSLLTKKSLTGTTVADVLTGPNGLVQTLNDEWANMAKEGKLIGKADTFNIVIDPKSGIGDALITDPSFYNKDRTPLFTVKKPDGSSVRASEEALAINKASRVIETAQGQPITQVIEEIISQSSYIRDKLLVKDKEQISKVNKNDKNSTSNSKTKEVLSWYNINTTSTVTGWDNVRNMYTYNITYYISKYEVPYMLSTSVGVTTKYYGPHKKYDYWYTGNNKEILQFELTYNNLFFVGTGISSEAAENKLRGVVPNSPVTAQQADPTSLFAGASDHINSIKTFMYSADDLTKAHIKILGDPDYLMPAVGNGLLSAYSKWYGPDFTINPNSGQVFIEIDIKQVQDYNSDLGLLTGGLPGSTGPDSNIDFYQFPDDMLNKIKGFTFEVIGVVSHFNKGMFTQEIKTVLPDLDALSDGLPATAADEEQQTENGREPDTKKPTTSDTARPSQSNKNTSNNGREPIGTGGGRSSSAFAATDPRLNLSVNNYNPGTGSAKYITTGPDDDNNKVVKIPSNKQIVDSTRIDPVTLLPVRK